MIDSGMIFLQAIATTAIRFLLIQLESNDRILFACIFEGLIEIVIWISKALILLF